MAFPVLGHAASALCIPVRVHDGHQALCMGACGGCFRPVAVQLCCKAGACQVHEHLSPFCILSMGVLTLLCRHCILFVGRVLQTMLARIDGLQLLGR